MLQDATPPAIGVEDGDLAVLLAESPAMRALIDEVVRASALPGGVLISGERGTGRRIIAREIHRRSAGASAPFESLDCACPNVAAIETTLFGAPSGPAAAFPHSVSCPEAVGLGSLVHRAHGGTLFLAHLDALPSPAQWRLARILEEGAVAVGGEHRSEEVNLRPVASVEPIRRSAAYSHRIRQDLFNQVAAIRIDVPPLRERREDIPGLALTFLADECARLDQPPLTIDPDAISVLSAMPWHGNAVELRVLMRHLAQRVSGPCVRLEDALGAVQLQGGAKSYVHVESLRSATRRFERDFILTTLDRYHGHMGHAAEALGVHRPNLYRKMRSLGMEGERRT